MDSKIELLRKIPFFSCFPDDASLASFIQVGNFSKLSSGSTVYRTGDAAHKLYVVVSGKIRITRNNKVLASLGHGEVFGEVAPFLDSERTVTAVSAGDSILFEFEKTELEHTPLPIRYEILKFLYVSSMRRFVETVRKATMA